MEANVPIEFRCIQCDRLLRTDDETSGRPTRCPECGTTMIVPEPGGAPISADPGEVQTEPPPDVLPAQPPAPPIDPELRAYAASRVAAPALGLLLIGVLGLLSQLMVLTLPASEPRAWRLPEPLGPNPLAEGLWAVVVCVRAALDLLIVVGALRMQKLRSHGLALLASALATVPYSCVCPPNPCCLPVWVFGLAFGVWGVVVLSDVHVRAAFTN